MFCDCENINCVFVLYDLTPHLCGFISIVLKLTGTRNIKQYIKIQGMTTDNLISGNGILTVK